MKNTFFTEMCWFFRTPIENLNEFPYSFYPFYIQFIGQIQPSIFMCIHIINKHGRNMWKKQIIPTTSVNVIVVWIKQKRNLIKRSKTSEDFYVAYLLYFWNKRMYVICTSKSHFFKRRCLRHFRKGSNVKMSQIGFFS